ncbi:cytochrome P450 [Cadophora sp. DSE1049]|nr:cytochrome P450 [Cadophora sp. DSE1049]
MTLVTSNPMGLSLVGTATILFAGWVLFELSKMIYFTRFHSLKLIPGPWFPASSSLWMRWQRWQGKLSFTVDDLLAKYGPVVRIAPNMVLVNDSEALAQIGGINWTQGEISAEIAGQILTATETTSSALAFIFYELAKNQSLMEELYNEIRDMDGYTNIENLKLLDACIKEGLRFRPPVAFTGSRL